MHDLAHALIRNTNLRREFSLRGTSGVSRSDDDAAFAGGKGEIKQLAKLAALRLGCHRIATQLGRSPAWAHDHLTRIRQAQRESVDPGVHFATAELDVVVVEGNDWPHNRDGDDLGPVPVRA
jgi:hypothetical protein